MDYLGKISMKMLTMETTKLQSAACSSSSSSSLPLHLPITGVYYSLPLNPGSHQMTMEGPVKAEPAVNTCDWRTCLSPDSRKKNANKIKGTLQKHFRTVRKKETNSSRGLLSALRS
uniref:Uncharacterized protein n=1 Tax=Brassica campestris TaxID=3711 RepID=A0A3P5YDZ1_BRACM|nr:unnamed protein product [Brassica rapa]